MDWSFVDSWLTSAITILSISTVGFSVEEAQSLLDLVVAEVVELLPEDFDVDLAPDQPARGACRGLAIATSGS